MDSKKRNSIIQWLMEGDPSIQYLCKRDLLGQDDPSLQDLVSKEGWGKAYMDLQLPNGHWGHSYYYPKWISTHYSLLDLRWLHYPRGNARIDQIIDRILKEDRGKDGGINPAKTVDISDVCLVGMVLNVFCWFGTAQDKLKELVDYVLLQPLEDGGFNCEKIRPGATHSSLHSSLSVCEGLWEYERQDYSYRIDEVRQARLNAQEFILMHRLYKSDRTGEIINRKFLQFPWPRRWFYDILSCMDNFRDCGQAYDPRMQDALDYIKSKQTKEGKWKVNAQPSGKQHFILEPAGKTSRFNTLRALRVLDYYKQL